MLIKEYTLPILLSDKSFNSIYDVQQDEVNQFKFNINDLVNQCFVDKATWGLKYWEDLLGVDITEESTFQQRRGAIKSALIGQGTVTVEVIKDAAKAFTGEEVEVKENTEPFSFEVKFVGIKGIPLGIEDFKKRIDIIKPAHLLVKYEFTYNTYLDIQAFKFKTLNAYTWEELNSGKITSEFSHEKLKKYTHEELRRIL